MLERFLHLAASQNLLYQQALECLEYFCVIATLVSKSLQKILWTVIKVGALRTQRFSASFHFTYIGTTLLVNACVGMTTQYDRFPFRHYCIHVQGKREVVRRGANHCRLYVLVWGIVWNFLKFVNVQIHKLKTELGAICTKTFFLRYMDFGSCVGIYLIRCSFPLLNTNTFYFYK